MGGHGGIKWIIFIDNGKLMTDMVVDLLWMEVGNLRMLAQG